MRVDVVPEFRQRIDDLLSPGNLRLFMAAHAAGQRRRRATLVAGRLRVADGDTRSDCADCVTRAHPLETAIFLLSHDGLITLK